MKKGYLLLETGEAFPGYIIGEETGLLGQVVFHTSMTGHEEIIKDPVYAGQILVFSYPIVGNNGVPSSLKKTITHSLSGLVIGEVCEEMPNEDHGLVSLTSWLIEERVPTIINVDTRALVKVIRKYGSVSGMILTVDHEEIDSGQWEKKVVVSPVEELTTKNIYSFNNGGPHVIIVDGGAKATIQAALQKEKCTVTIVPISSTYDQVKDLAPDGIVLSNGPGDPRELAHYFSNIKEISSSFPTLGIGLGHQLVALAHGAEIEKHPQGHRGINYAVKDQETGKVYMTAQSHGYQVNLPSLAGTDLTISYENINDKSIEGLKHKYLPIKTVQFNPVAQPGPRDTAFIVKEFVEDVVSTRGKNYAEV